jgi:hypothetical protein
MRSKILCAGFDSILGRALATAAVAMAALWAPGGTPRAAAGEASDPAGATTPAQSASGALDWVGTWATALTAASAFDTNRSRSGFDNESIRMIVQTSIGGPLVRIRLSNAHGDRALTIGHATVGRPATPSAADLDPRTLHPLSFRGRPSVTVPAGADVVSDPVPMLLPPFSQLAVTIASDLRDRGIRVVLSTIVPATGDRSWTPVREATRQAINQYVRTTRDADGVVDFDLALRDPANPAQLNPAFDRGDHVHPNEQGNQAIADIVPLSRL